MNDLLLWLSVLVILSGIHRATSQQGKYRYTNKADRGELDIADVLSALKSLIWFRGLLLGRIAVAYYVRRCGILLQTEEYICPAVFLRGGP